MATAPGGRITSPSRRPAWVSGLGLAAWAAGAVGLLVASRERTWQPGELVLAGSAWLTFLAVAFRGPVRQIFGPVFAYEVLRLGRRPSTFLLRGLYVAAACGFLAMMFLSWLEDVGYFHPRPGATGKVTGITLSHFSAKFFYAFQMLQLVVVAALTPAYVAGTVTDEKERKTLEFMLATDLDNREIVFGKLAARVLLLLMFVLAGLPLLSFLQLFGGIDPELLLAGTTAAVVTVIGLSAWSICVSVLMKRSRDAIAFAYLTVLVYAGGGTMLGVLIREAYGTATVTALGIEFAPTDAADWFADGNIGYLLGTEAITGQPWVGPALGKYVLWWGVVGGALLLVAVARLRAVALRQAYGEPRGGRRRRRDRTRPIVGENPVFWKEVFVDAFARRSAAGWVIAALIGGLIFSVPAIIVVSQFGDRSPWLREQLGLTPQHATFDSRWRQFQDAIGIWVRVSTGIVGGLAFVSAAIRGAATITGEKDRDTWVSLVSTPLSSWEMLTGKWWGCVLGIRQVYAALVVVWAVGLAVGAVLPAMIPWAALFTAVYVAAFAWLGIYCSTTSRTTLIATVKAVAAAGFFGGGYLILFVFFCVLPLEMMSRNFGATERQLLQNILQILLGLMPPFVVGWLPLPDLETRHLEPFAWERGEPIFGPLAPMIGLTVWASFAAGLAWLSLHQFRVLVNREPSLPRRSLAVVNRPPESDGIPTRQKDVHADAGKPSA